MYECDVRVFRSLVVVLVHDNQVNFVILSVCSVGIVLIMKTQNHGPEGQVSVLPAEVNDQK